VTPVPSPAPTTGSGSGPGPTASDPLASHRAIVRSTLFQVEDREGSTATDLRPSAGVARKNAPASTTTADPVTPSVTLASTPAVISAPRFRPPAEPAGRGIGVLVELLIALVVLPLVVWKTYEEWKAEPRPF
jgi:hypothetical protein